MLEEIHITDFALIDDVLIEFGAGLNVLTGETGAGKTILLQALGLLLGDRADMSALRAGKAEARVEGRLRLDDREIVVARVISAEGKSKCYLDGGLVSVSMLAGLVAPLVDLHGQHQHQALLRPASHVDYLDRFCGPEQMERRAAWSKGLSELNEVRARRAQLEKMAAEIQREKELLRFQAEEIEAARLQEGEDDELRDALEVLRNAERLKGLADAAYACIEGEEPPCALDLLRRANAGLAEAGGIDARLDELATRFTSLGYEVEEAARDLRAYTESIEMDPQRLRSAEERALLLQELKRKYGSSIAEILSYGSEARERLAEMRAASEEIDALVAGESSLEEKLARLALQMRNERKKTAKLFAARVQEELRLLEMGNAIFCVKMSERGVTGEDTYGSTGQDEVEFAFSANKGETARPLTKVASGGELSRLMLAAKVVLGEADRVPLLVFDEIDAGIGGKTAAAVGEKLARLAETHQVICVTHLPQIASRGDRHFQVRKVEDGGRTKTAVESVRGDRRISEIARMLSGAKVSDVSMRHAREMLEGAQEKSVKV